MRAKHPRSVAREPISLFPTTKTPPRPNTSANRDGMNRGFFGCLCGVHVVLVLLILLSSATAQEHRRIHYGTTASTAHLPIWVGKDAGYFAKYGMNVEPIHIRGG